MTNGTGASSQDRLPVKRRVVLLVCGVLVAVVGITVILACLPVSDFTAPSTTEELDRRARQFEQSFASEVTRVRDLNTPWAIRMVVSILFTDLFTARRKSTGRSREASFGTGATKD